MDAERLVKATLSAEAFWSVNKALARKIGIEEAALSAEIIAKHSYWKARDELDDQGGFFMTSEDIQEVMGIGIKPVARLTKSILTQGVVKIKKRGVPAKNYWYPQWPFLLDILGSEPQTGLSSNTQKGSAIDSQKGSAITKNTYKKYNTKSNAAEPPALLRRLTDLIGEAHKHLTGYDLVWEGNGQKYGKAMKSIMTIVEKLSEDEAYQAVRDKCAAYVIASRSDDFMKKQGVTPLSILSSWNKIHFKKEQTKPDALKSADVHWLDDPSTTELYKTEKLIQGIFNGNLLPKRWIEWETRIYDRLTAKGYSASEILSQYREKEAKLAATQTARMAS